MNKLDAAISDWENGNYDKCFPILENYAEKNNIKAQFIMAKAYSSDNWGKEILERVN